MINREIDRVHDILTDLLCSAVQFVPHEEPKVGDWCYETTSRAEQNRDCRIGILKEIISKDEFVTVTIGGKEIHWTNADVIKIPATLLRNQYRNS